MSKSGRVSFSNLRKSAFICGSFLLLFMAASEAHAQGGKAEPNRIEFKRGATSTTISGTVRNDEQAEYVLSARQGQRMIIKLTNVPAKSSCFDLQVRTAPTLAWSTTATGITRRFCPRPVSTSSTCLDRRKRGEGPGTD